MKIGVPKEIKNQEHRVSMTPSSVRDLVNRGHSLFVESNAGHGSNYTDDQYEEAGATMLGTAQEIFDTAEMIVKVKEPQPAEVAMLKPHHILFTYLHLAADKNLTETLIATGATCIAYETIEVNHQLPLLEPMSEIAGRMSPIVGAYHLAKHENGRGTLISGVPGVNPGKVLVIGGGTAGVNAARVAKGMGADVTIMEINLERMRFLDITLPNIKTVYSTSASLAELLPNTDLIIGAVLIPGAAAPKLITRDMLKIMRPGSVFVDIAVDQGGCAETTVATTHEEPTFIVEDVVHYCVANMPGAYARTSTQALNNATHAWTALIADNGVKAACERKEDLVDGINCIAGQLTCQPVADAHGMENNSAVDILNALEVL